MSIYFNLRFSLPFHPFRRSFPFYLAFGWEKLSIPLAHRLEPVGILIKLSRVARSERKKYVCVSGVTTSIRIGLWNLTNRIVFEILLHGLGINWDLLIHATNSVASKAKKYHLYRQ